MNKFYIAIAIFVAGLLVGIFITDNTWQAKWDTAEKTAAQNQLNAVNKAVEVYVEREKKQEIILNETKQKLAEAYLADAAAADTGNSLSDTYAASLRGSGQCPDNSPSVRELAAIATNETVQAYVFRSVVTEAVRYAGIAEEAITRGEGCQQEYESLRF